MKRSFQLITIITSLVLSLCINSAAWAVPALPRPILATQADGSQLYIQNHGDEHFAWRTTQTGTPVVMRDGFYRFVNFQMDGSQIVSEAKVFENGRYQALPAGFAKQDMGYISSTIMNNRRAEISNMQRVSSPQRIPSTFPTKGKVNSLVILVEFADNEFTIEDPNKAFHNALNLEGYDVAGATGSARDFFHANSDGQFDADFHVVGPYKLPRNMAYYGGTTGMTNDANPTQMVIDAVTLADADVDFSEYDVDDNGMIDNIFLYYAGYNEAETLVSDYIWPHKFFIQSKPEFDGKQLYDYACTSELRGEKGATIAGIGTFCHEFSHVFGLCDHYDTDGATSGYSNGLGEYDIMTLGAYNNSGNTPPLFNAQELYQLNWAQPMEFITLGEYTLAPIHTGEFYKIKTDVEDEYFLIENRTKSASVWDTYIPGEGLIISHVDRSSQYMSKWDANKPNNDINHECFRFISAGGLDSNKFGYGDEDWATLPFPASNNGNDRWNSGSNPAAKSWSGKDLSVALSMIWRDGDNMKFTVSRGDGATDELATIVGRVVDAESGEALSGIELFFERENPVAGETGISVFTDDEGNFTITTALAYNCYTVHYAPTATDNYLPLTLLTPALKPFKTSDPEGTTNTLDDIKLQKNILGELAMLHLYSKEGELQGLSSDGKSITIAAEFTQSELQAFAGSTINYGSASFAKVENPSTTLQIISCDASGTLREEARSENRTTGTGLNLYKFDQEVTIKPSRTYYIAATFTGEIHIDESANTNGGALLLNFNDFSTFAEGAVALALYADLGEITPLTAIKVAAVSSDEPTVGIPYQLKATLTPQNATIQSVEWSSSDEKIATVNALGEVLPLTAGSVKIIAKSTYHDVQGSIEINISNTQGVSGQILDQDGKGIDSQDITFYPLVASTHSEALSQMRFTRSGEGDISIESDAQGCYIAELAAGYYGVEIVRNGYAEYNSVILVEAGAQRADFTLSKLINATSNLFAHSEGEISGAIGNIGNSYTVLDIWTAEELKDEVGNYITHVNATVGGGAKIRFVVYESALNNNVFTSEVIEAASVGYTTLFADIDMEQKIKIRTNIDYYIGYEVIEHALGSAPTAISTTSKSGSQIIVRNGESSTAEAAGLNANTAWNISMRTQSNDQLESFTADAGQTDIVLEWYSQDYDYFSIEIYDEDRKSQSFSASQSSYHFTGLTPDMEYDIIIDGRVEDGKWTRVLYTKQVTSAAHTTIPAILLREYTHTEGEKIYLRAINLEKEDSVEWFINGTPTDRDSVVLTAGEYTISCTVNRDGEEYTCRRNIEVIK